MRNLPQFITFTGADNKTSVPEMVALSKDYPIEWGILFSPKNVGEPRYPTWDWIAIKLLSHADEFKLSAHICGGFTRELIESGKFIFDMTLKQFFDRAQINTAKIALPVDMLASWAESNKLKAIIQTRGIFPTDLRFDWLFDQSGGKGLVAESFPRAVDNRLTGYAGGLNPENVQSAINKIELISGDYWIDMESGVRDENGDFSIDKCRQVCEIVYGA